MGQSNRQVMLCFQCWQVVSSFFLAGWTDHITSLDSL